MVLAQDSILTLGNPSSDALFLKELDGFTTMRREKIKRFDKHSSFDAALSDFGLRSAKATSNKPAKQRGYLVRKLVQEHLVQIDTGDFYLIIDPAFNFEGGRDFPDNSGERLYVNTRGVSIHGKIGRNMSFYSRFYENQAFLPAFLDDFISEYGVVPGQGRIKPFKDTGYDFSMASGAVSFSPNKRLNIQLGTGKQFLGDGYRSLALSRNAFNYPFIKITSWFGPFQYTNLFMGLQNLNVELPTSTVTERRFQRKIGTIHHLDWSVNDKITVGVFEQMIWASLNSKGKLLANSDVLSFLNPIPFIRPLQYGFSDENNVLVGMNWKVMWPKRTMFYGQFVLDDIKKGKNGFQVGVRSWVVRNLILRAEYNQVAPYTYGYADSTRNFAHYNQAMAHPLGAGFSEVSASLTYFINSFFLQVRVNYAEFNDDSEGYHWGKYLFKSEENNPVGSAKPPLGNLFNQTTLLGYEINRVTGMRVSLGITNRLEQAIGGVENTQYVFLSFSTNIPERIYDF